MKIMPTAVLLFCIFSILHFDVTTENEESFRANLDSRYLKFLLRTGRYEEFNKLVQNGHVNLEKQKEDDLEFNDVLLEPIQTEQERQGIKFADKPSKKWENNAVPYVILPDGFSETNKAMIEKAINSFNNQVKNIKFRKRNNEKDYVTITAGNNGCYSNLGRVGGENIISLQPSGCLKEGTIQHEMIHTLGFNHEQNRPDRDNYIEILYENIPEAWRGNYQKVSGEDYSTLGNYDYYSVMHYRIKAPGTRKPAFKILQKDIALTGIGQRLAMTKDDIAKINELYS